MGIIPHLDMALKYAELGLYVLTVHSIVDGACTCRKGKECSSPGKHPRPRKGFRAGTTNRRQIRRWWRDHPESNLGIATGAPSGVVVIDVDARHDGEASIAAAQQEHGKLPQGPFCLTGGGGWHLYLAHPGGRVRSRVRLLPGVDVRADGGMVVAPFSNHASGDCYAWETPLGEVALPEIPPAWLDLIQGNGATKAQQEREGDKHVQESVEDIALSLLSLPALVGGPLEEAVERAIVTTLPTAHGERHDTMFEFCRALQAIPGILGKPAGDMQGYVQRWHNRALPLIVDARQFADHWADFVESWPNVKFPKGHGIMDRALARAKASPDVSAAAAYESPEMGILVAVCRELQEEVGDDTEFYLSGKSAGKIVGRTGRQAARWLNLLCVVGYLEKTEPGNQRRANRYRVLRSFEDAIHSGNGRADT